MENIFIDAIELIGTIAFAASGAMVAINKKMDMFGVAMMGVFTAVGGGIIRDILIGDTPPWALKNPMFTVIAIIVSIIAFLPSVRKKVNLDHPVWVFIDAIGLGLFVVLGVQKAVQFNSFFIEVVIGTVTGVGGGMLRDICAREMPVIFARHFYACACIIGSMVCAVIYPYNQLIAMLVGAILIVVIRMLAAKYKWHLPRA